MASTLFNINPTTGRGNTTVNVSVNEINGGTQDKVATVTVSNGANSDTVTLRQKYCPYFVQFASTTFPASGGNIYFTIHSEYDVVFRSVPNWITISDGHGTTFAEGQRISSGTVDGQTFTLTADANTGAARTVAATFNMGHYIGQYLQNRVTYFSFTQEAYVPPTPPTPTVTWQAYNRSEWNVYGNLHTGSTQDYAGLEVHSGETEDHSEAVPATLTSAYLALSPAPQNPENYSIVLSNSTYGDSMVCPYDSVNGAWVGTGSVRLEQGTILDIAVI